jgi:hypothetical protein
MVAHFGVDELDIHPNTGTAALNAALEDITDVLA